MSPLLRTAGILGLSASLGLGVLTGAAGEPPVHPQPAEITSDTEAYCMHLLDRVSELVRAAPTPPPAEVARLSDDGRRMCDRGEVRGGILRLRHAVMLLLHPPEAQR